MPSLWYVCHFFKSPLQISTIASIRQSVLYGHTVIMCQTNDIQESFYELFNQKFTCIEDAHIPGKQVYYTNIAIGSLTKPSIVGEKFQCIVVVKESEVHDTPAAFLNRFEKYHITHESIFLFLQASMPPKLRQLVLNARKQVS